MRTIGSASFNLDSGSGFIEAFVSPNGVIVQFSDADRILQNRISITREQACAVAEAFEFLGVRPSYIERAYERCGEPKAGE